MRLAALIAALGIASCGGGDGRETCEGFTDFGTSPYVLPYEVGSSHLVVQGNCSPPGNGHRGPDRYGYDFSMAIGTRVLAAREGTAIEVESSHFDGQVAATGLDNYLVVRHADGTVALYGHFTHEGVAVKVGDAVAQGQPVGFSGNTGNTANVPHLHFSVQICDPVTGGSAACHSAPNTFRNTDPNPAGLEVGRSYTAR
jgi:murein DD-endopeptidase MepM/ murein hydrolase activator NlpD